METTSDEAKQLRLIENLTKRAEILQPFLNCPTIPLDIVRYFYNSDSLHSLELHGLYKFRVGNEWSVSTEAFVGACKRIGQVPGDNTATEGELTAKPAGQKNWLDAEWWTVSQAAEFLSLSPDFVRRLYGKGELIPHKRGTAVRLRSAEVRQWAKTQG